jgi:hypothetical protein
VKDVNARQGILVDLFSRIERFLRRLEIYSEVPPTASMTEITVDIMVEVLTVVGTATKDAKCGRMSELISRWFFYPY